MITTGNPWLDLVSLAAIASVLVQMLKPFIEKLPGIGTTGEAHDSLLRILLYAANLAGVCLLAAQAGRFSWAQFAQYVVIALIAAGSGHVAYQMYTAGKVDAPLPVK